MLSMTEPIPIKPWSNFESMDSMLSEIEAEFALILSIAVEIEAELTPILSMVFEMLLLVLIMSA